VLYRIRPPPASPKIELYSTPGNRLARYSPRFGARILHHVKLEAAHPGTKPAEVRSQAVAGFTVGVFDDRSDPIYSACPTDLPASVPGLHRIVHIKIISFVHDSVNYVIPGVTTQIKRGISRYPLRSEITAVPSPVVDRMVRYIHGVARYSDPPVKDAAYL